KDIIRDNAKNTIKELKRMGKNIVLLSGDNEKTANIIAKELSIDHVIANVLPKEKEKVIQDYIQDGHYVMMVGDGINDAPSLASSNIGVSINGGTDIAGDSADVILMQDDLSKIPSFLRISKKTVKIIKENLFWAFFYNLLMIPVAIGLLKPFGISIHPMLASISMTISSLCVVFNSLRLKRNSK
ncbi:MAG: HAD-IC family P-type ATPase, partial [Bacilli bacterium]|nr:HAD-IC family P-type ATPase [Bacilli bacterium]